MNGRRGDLISYATGYVLSLALTIAAFAIVRWPSLGTRTTFAVILILGVIQMAVQFRCFLHISLKRSSRHDLQLIIFSTLIIVLMVSGTLVIIFNLRERMM